MLATLLLLLLAGPGPHVAQPDTVPHARKAHHVRRGDTEAGSYTGKVGRERHEQEEEEADSTLARPGRHTRRAKP